VKHEQIRPRCGSTCALGGPKWAFLQVTGTSRDAEQTQTNWGWTTGRFRMGELGRALDDSDYGPGGRGCRLWVERGEVEEVEGRALERWMKRDADEWLATAQSTRLHSYEDRDQLDGQA